MSDPAEDVTTEDVTTDPLLEEAELGFFDTYFGEGQFKPSSVRLYIALQTGAMYIIIILLIGVCFKYRYHRVLRNLSVGPLLILVSCLGLLMSVVLNNPFSDELCMFSAVLGFVSANNLVCTMAALQQRINKLFVGTDHVRNVPISNLNLYIKIFLVQSLYVMYMIIWMGKDPRTRGLNRFGNYECVGEHASYGIAAFFVPFATLTFTCYSSCKMRDKPQAYDIGRVTMYSHLLLEVLAIVGILGYLAVLNNTLDFDLVYGIYAVACFGIVTIAVSSYVIFPLMIVYKVPDSPPENGAKGVYHLTTMIGSHVWGSLSAASAGAQKVSIKQVFQESMRNFLGNNPDLHQAEEHDEVLSEQTIQLTHRQPAHAASSKHAHEPHGHAQADDDEEPFEVNLYLGNTNLASSSRSQQPASSFSSPQQRNFQVAHH